MSRTIKIGVGHNNAVAGERHHNAKLTDHEVDLVLALYEGRSVVGINRRK